MTDVRKSSLPLPVFDERPPSRKLRDLRSSLGHLSKSSFGKSYHRCKVPFLCATSDQIALGSRKAKEGHLRILTYEFEYSVRPGTMAVLPLIIAESNSMVNVEILIMRNSYLTAHRAFRIAFGTVQRRYCFEVIMPRDCTRRH